MLRISQHLYAQHMPAQHYQLTTAAIQSLIKASLPSVTTPGLTSPPQLTSSNNSMTQSAEQQGNNPTSHPSDTRAADDMPRSANMGVEADMALVTQPDAQASAMEQTWLLTPGGIIDTQAATSAAALCQPSLLAVALKAAQTGNCQPEVFSLHTSHSDGASGSQDAHDSGGMECLLLICVLAASSCWCSGKDLDSVALNSADNEPRAPQVYHA